MDKICRGSRIGEARVPGAPADAQAPQKPQRTEASSPPPRAGKPLRKEPSAAFRPQEWFLHGGNGGETPTKGAPQSPRRQKGAGACSPQDPSLPRSWLQQNRSLKCLQKASNEPGLETPRSPRLPRELARGKSEAWLTGRDLPECSPRRNLCKSPRGSQGRPWLDEGAEERGRRPAEGAASPRAEVRSPSPTYRVSEDWMAYSSPRGKRDPDSTGNSGHGVESTMQSSKFSPRLLRQQSGRITESSDNWLRANGENAKPAPPAIANSETFALSRGKKTDFTKEDSNVKRRLKLDSTEPVPCRTQKRHDFPDNPHTQRQMDQLRQLSPRGHSVVAESSSVTGGGLGGQVSCVVDVQHRTSAAMAASIMPEIPEMKVEGGEAAAVAQRKLLIGNELVDLKSSGRRTAPVIVQQAAQASLSQKALSMVSIRDQRNSDNIREQLQSPAPAAQVERPFTARSTIPCTYPGAPAHPGAIQPAVSVPPLIQALDQRVYSFGEFSSLPSTMQKDTAYMHSGLHVVKFGTRGAGAFSPNVARVPATQALAC